LIWQVNHQYCQWHVRFVQDTIITHFSHLWNVFCFVQINYLSLDLKC
jgi:hypothetical protein